MPSGIPLIAYLSAASPVLPVVVAVGKGRVLENRWVLAACLISLVGDATGLFYSNRGQNNLWISYLVTPLQFACMLLALAALLTTAQEQMTVKLTAVLLLAVSGVLAVMAEDLSNFSRYSLPLGSLLVLGASVWTLVRQGSGSALGTAAVPGGFWLPSGFAIYGAVMAAYMPLLGGFVSSDRGFVEAVLKVKSALVIVSFCLVAWGISCQNRATVSGRSSLPSSSPSGSS